jgi:tripartite-type tricarboxylate transporter receptor subunit TctC
MKSLLSKTVLIVCVGLIAFAGNFSIAQTPLRIITTDQPGGGTDALIRPMAERLATQLGRPVVVDNKPGTQGRIAGAALMAAPVDGNTIMITVQASVVMNPHVYKYPYDPLTDLVPGVINFFWSGPAGTVGQMLKAGRIKAHAYMGQKRSNGFPDIPTVRELGYSNIESDGWIGVFAAKGTSNDVVAKLQVEIAKAINKPEIKAFYSQIGFEPGGMSVIDFANTVKADSLRWAAYIKKINYRPE